MLLFGEEVSIGFERLLLILGGCTQTSHTPGPSPEGSFGCCFLLGNKRFGYDVSPLERRVLRCYFMFDNRTFVVYTSPLKRGSRGM